MSSLPVTLTTAAGAVIDLSDLVEALADVAAAIAGGSVSVEDSAAAALLTTIDADTSKIPALGSAAMAASSPVTIATDDTMMTALDAAVDTIAGAVDGTEMQADIVGALPAGDNNIGNVDVLSLPTAIQGPGNPTIDSYADAAINAATGSRTEIIAAPGANKQLWIYGITMTCDTVDVTVTLESGTTAKSGAMPMADNGGIAIPPSGNFAMPYMKCAENEAFNITMGTGVGDGICQYAIVSV